jgi:hypothetical protein
MGIEGILFHFLTDVAIILTLTVAWKVILQEAHFFNAFKVQQIASQNSQFKKDTIT